MGIANLWMAEYCLEAGNKKKARECFEFVVKTATEHGYLAEQIDNSTMQAKWVIGLGWSHAMFIDVLQNYTNKKMKSVSWQNAQSINFDLFRNVINILIKGELYGKTKYSICL